MEAPGQRISWLYTPLSFLICGQSGSVYGVIPTEGVYSGYDIYNVYGEDTVYIKYSKKCQVLNEVYLISSWLFTLFSWMFLLSPAILCDLLRELAVRPL